MGRQEKTVYVLKSRCPKCQGISVIRYTEGIENHRCDKGHTWEKNPESTQQALLAIQKEFPA